jgi:hypothetical protein
VLGPNGKTLYLFNATSLMPARTATRPGGVKNILPSNLAR